ncbi:MAG: DUF2723 domain-containing protein [Candidatus Sericytochromatia bacterium]|nr:DUF2723 domain-containing protein [Candidatus Tanganyikabacteria bacterium]
MNPPSRGQPLSPEAGRRLVAAAGAAAAAFLVALAIYVPMLPDDVGVWDVAEFQTVPHVLGIAHPTGYPLYTLAGKLWLLLFPAGSVAWRMNLASALAAAGGAGLLAGICAMYAGPLLGIAFGLTFAFAPSYWRVALRADPHSLAAALWMALLAAALAWDARRRGLWLGLTLLLFGLGLANHALALTVAPALALLLIGTWPGREVTGRQAAGLLALLGTGPMLYAYLPLRGAMHPPLAYTDPTTPRRFWELVSGAQFHGAFGLPDWGVLGSRLAGYPAYLATWYTAPGAVALGLLALAGLGGFARRNPLLGAFLTLSFVAPWFVAGQYQNADLDRYYFGPHAVLFVLAAAGAGVALRTLGHWRDARIRQARLRGAGQGRPGASRFALIPGPTVVAMFALVLPAWLAWTWRAPLAGESRDGSGRPFLEAVYRQAPENAVVLSWWNLSTPLWYGRWVEGRRPDLTIVDHRDLRNDTWRGDFVAYARTAAGSRPLLTVYQDRDLDILRAAGYRLEPIDDPEFGRVGFSVTPASPSK